MKRKPRVRPHLGIQNLQDRIPFDASGMEVIGEAFAPDPETQLVQQVEPVADSVEIAPGSSELPELDREGMDGIPVIPSIEYPLEHLLPGSTIPPTELPPGSIELPPGSIVPPMELPPGSIELPPGSIVPPTELPPGSIIPPMELPPGSNDLGHGNIF